MCRARARLRLHISSRGRRSPAIVGDRDPINTVSPTGVSGGGAVFGGKSTSALCRSAYIGGNYRLRRRPLPQMV
jgi:hypothetical protein